MIYIKLLLSTKLTVQENYCCTHYNDFTVIWRYLQTMILYKIYLFYSNFFKLSVTYVYPACVNVVIFQCCKKNPCVIIYKICNIQILKENKITSTSECEMVLSAFIFNSTLPLILLIPSFSYRENSVHLHALPFG